MKIDPKEDKVKKKTTQQNRTWAVKNTNPSKGKAACAKQHRTSVAAAPRKRATPVKAKTSAPTKKKSAQLAQQNGLFGGATEISMTKNKISVTKKVSASRNGRFEQHEVRTYHDKTPANMRALQSAIQSGDAKKVTVKFK